MAISLLCTYSRVEWSSARSDIDCCPVVVHGLLPAAKDCFLSDRLEEVPKTALALEILLHRTPAALYMCVRDLAVHCLF